MYLVICVSLYVNVNLKIFLDVIELVIIKSILFLNFYILRIEIFSIKVILKVCMDGIYCDFFEC